MDEIIEDLDWQFNAIDNINTMIVTGGFVYDGVDWIYPGDGTLTHFDVETEIYPVDGATMPTVYLNAGTDNDPVWQSQAIGSYDELEAIFSGVVVLYQLESHWFYWQTAPSQLEKSWRVVGRIKRRLRATVSDDANIAATGVELADTITNDSITSEDEAFAVGKTELANRDGTSTFEFDTYQPGLLPGRLLTLVDTSRDIDHTAIIQHVDRTYIGGGYAKFHVIAGRDPDDLADVIAEIDSKATGALMPPRTRAIDTPISETLRQLINDNSADLVDDDFAYLFDIAP
jgi:hypothetical protein